MTTVESTPLNQRQLALATVSFAVTFAAWGLISAFAPTFRKTYGLSATETSLLVAVPVLLGALMRLPLGLLADRFGGRRVFGALLVISAVPAFLGAAVDSYQGLLVVAFAIGLAGSSFPVGIGHVSRWTPPARRGGALGIYGLGNMGQSAVVFLGPLLAVSIGWQGVFRGLAAVLVVWAVVWGLLARDPPGPAKPAGWGAIVRILRHEPLAWVLSGFYFLTFGGFVAFAVYLPTLLRDQFALAPGDAGFRAAGFVVLATLMRPVGGWLADRIGGARVLAGVFAGIVPFALLLSWPSILPFTVGALGSAALLGIGNGAVFQLVPSCFPAETATVTGLVGAMGGLGGFFPPLLLGVFRDRLGAYWPGFVLLAATAATMALVNQRVFLARREAEERVLPPALQRLAGQLRAGAWATMVTALLVAAIVVGSRNLANFDPALVVYTFAIIFATWGVTYHYNVWLQKPPTALYWRRGWELFRQRGWRSLAHLPALFGRQILAQGFIRARSRQRWWMHQLLFWGCLLAAAITFPLVFGWVHFTSDPQAPNVYITHLFGFTAGSFPLGSPLAWVIFHGLDISAVLVLGGIALALGRRLRDQGALALQSFGMDFFPLFLLFAVCVTGLALTVSTAFLRGTFYPFLAILHAITVIATLLYLPFGKLFHIFQRPAQIGVKLYQEVGEADPGAWCRACGERYASAMHVADLKTVLPGVGFDYQMAAGEAAVAPHWLDLCPTCKRRGLAAAQLRLKESIHVPPATV